MNIYIFTAAVAVLSLATFLIACYISELSRPSLRPSLRRTPSLGRRHQVNITRCGDAALLLKSDELWREAAYATDVEKAKLLINLAEMAEAFARR